MTKVDSAAFMVPLLVSLNIYDFMSDINLSITIFQNSRTQFQLDNILFLIAKFNASTDVVTKVASQK